MKKNIAFLGPFSCFSIFFYALASMGTVAFGASSGQSTPLDNIDFFPRASAMGSAFTGVADDASALLGNPAGLAFLPSGEICENSDFWLVDTFQETILLGIPSSSMDAGWAMDWSYFNYGTFEGRDENGSLTSNYGGSLMSLRVGGGMKLLPFLSVGAAVQGTQVGLADDILRSFTSSVGVLTEPFEHFRLGMSYENLSFGSNLNSPQPSFVWGTSYEAPLDSSNRFLGAIGGVLEPGAVDYLQIGVEYGYRQIFFLRAGYQLPLNDNRIQGLTGLTAGVGFAFADLSLDYAFLPYGELGASHSLSLGYHFGVLEKKNEAPPLGVHSEPEKVPPQGISQPQQASGSDVPGSLVLQFDLPSDTIEQGLQLEREGHLQEAIQVYQDCLRKNSRDLSAWWALGDVYRRLNKKDYALSCFEQVIKLEPGNQKMADWLQRYKEGKP